MPTANVLSSRCCKTKTPITPGHCLCWLGLTEVVVQQPQEGPYWLPTDSGSPAFFKGYCPVLSGDAGHEKQDVVHAKHVL